MRLEQTGIPEESVLAALHERLAPEASFASGRILGCMCSDPDPIARRVFATYLEKNAGDPGLFHGTFEIEREAVSAIGDFLGAPAARGSLLTGGTEANILAMLSARRSAGRGKHEVILPESAHYSFDKAAELMDLELIKIPLDDRHQMRADSAERVLSRRTMAIVGVAGSTSLGAVDPIEELSDIAMRHDLYLHVDAAFGGFVLPFLEEAGYPTRKFDFSLPGVRSITADPHKMGRAGIPAGCLLFRDEESARLAETRVPYLSGGEANQATLAGTRSGAAGLAVWATLKHLGREGYVRIVHEAMAITYRLKERLAEIDGVEIVAEPQMNVLGLSMKGHSPRALADGLRVRGWAVAAFDRHIRLVVMPHVTGRQLLPFLEDLKGLAAR